MRASAMGDSFFFFLICMSESFISIWSGFSMHAMVQNHGDFHCSYDYKVHDCFFSDLYPGEVSKYPITTASKSKKKQNIY